MAKYIISVMRDHDDNGKMLWNGFEHYPVYISEDDHPFTGGIYFSKYFAKEFESIDETAEWFEKNKPYLSDYIEKYCDVQTLAIQQAVIRYETVQELKL